MKVLTIGHSESLGGAARAAYRVHCALRGQGIDSRMLVKYAGLGDWTVSSPYTGLQKVIARLAPHVAQQVCRLHTTTNPILRSPAFIPSRLLKQINASDADVVHLHWVASEMLTVEAIGRISKPLVWTLHDMWAFCGAEHYASDERWRDGYLKSNRPADERGWDLNRWVWQRKRKAWSTPLHIAAPSQWMADCADQSALMRGWPIRVVPNTLDTDAWSPLDKPQARALMGIGGGRRLVAFGAWGVEQAHKGFDLLLAALKLLQNRQLEFELLVFGQRAPQQPMDLGFPVHYAGHLNDDLSLRVAYSAADIMVVPSRVESFGQSASEAHACGTPVVAFNACGLRDIVDHKVTGYLAQPFDVQDLADGIEWVIAMHPGSAALGVNARNRAVAKFSYPVVADAYRRLYSDAVETYGRAA